MSAANKIIAFPRETSSEIWSASLPTAEVARAIASVNSHEERYLERMLLEVKERERRIIGQELRDHLCQHLLGMAFSAEVLAGALARDGSIHAPQVSQLASLINQSANQARNIASGLNPVELDSEGLMAALQELVVRTRQSIPCRFLCEQIIEVKDPQTAAHAFCIVQEAIAQALNQTEATEVTITLSEKDESVCLEVMDNGIKEGELTANPHGAAAEMLFCRVQAMQGELNMTYESGKGTSIVCTFPQKS